MNKKIKRFITVSCYLLAGFFIFASLSEGATPSTSKKNVWTDRQTFKCDVDIWQDLEFKTGATITGSPTWTGSPTITGNPTFTGSTFINGGFVPSGVTRFTSGTTALATYDYNTWYITTTGASVASGVTLPAITEAYDGFEITFKLVCSGATRFPIVVYSTDDVMESTQGTFTATSDANLDAAGDVRTWKAGYISGSSNVWYLVLDER